MCIWFQQIVVPQGLAQMGLEDVRSKADVTAGNLPEKPLLVEMR